MASARVDAKTPEPTFYEVVLEGPPEVSRGFLRGLLLGAGHDGYLDFGLERMGAGGSLGEKLREMIHLHPHECHAVVDVPVRDLLARSAASMERESGLRLAAQNQIRAARFSFHYQAFAPRYAREIGALLAALPAGLRREGGEPTETLDPDAHGIEAYSPAHEYEAKGEGRIVGRVDLVIEAWRRLDAHPLVQVETVELDLA